MSYYGMICVTSPDREYDLSLPCPRETQGRTQFSLSTRIFGWYFMESKPRYLAPRDKNDRISVK